MGRAPHFPILTRIRMIMMIGEMGGLDGEMVPRPPFPHHNPNRMMIMIGEMGRGMDDWRAGCMHGWGNGPRPHFPILTASARIKGS
jgi:hypothetical protein